MKQINLNTWEEFQAKLVELRGKVGSRQSPLLFRGQSDAAWHLRTTLERAGSERIKLAGYHALINAVRPAIESLTGVKWEMPDYHPDQNSRFTNYWAFENYPDTDLYRYLVYLRHHGFPSPLLDWSTSPYVAALFAFTDLESSAERAAIFAFCESPRGRKAVSGNEARIRRIGPYVRTHSRHFRQQSDYTICGMFNGAWQFWEHDAVFSGKPKDQDLLWKFTIPSTERQKVLRHLDEYNLNAFSLFGTEESLMQTVWLREFVFRRIQDDGAKWFAALGE